MHRSCIIIYIVVHTVSAFPFCISKLIDSLTPFDQHLFIAYHHAYLAGIQEVVMVSGQGGAVFIVQELRKREVVWEDERAEGVVGGGMCIVVHYVLDNLAVAGQVVYL